MRTLVTVVAVLALLAAGCSEGADAETLEEFMGNDGTGVLGPGPGASEQ